MNAIDRFKEYFGMSPVTAFEDEYLDDYDRPVPGERTVHHDRGLHADSLHDDRLHEHALHDRSVRDRRHELDEHLEPSYRDEVRGARDRREDYGYRSSSRHLDDEPAGTDPFRERRERREAVGLHRAVASVDELPPRRHRYSAGVDSGSRTVSGVGVTRGSSAVAPEEDFEDGLVTVPETVVERPRGFEDAKSLGEQFRAGNSVVLDLSSMAREDARRMVDFAAGLVLGLDGGMRKVPDRERTFLLQPGGSDLTESEVRKAVSDAFRG